MVGQESTSHVSTSNAEPRLALSDAPAPLHSISTPTTTLSPGTTLLSSTPLCQIPIFSSDEGEVQKRCWTCLDVARDVVLCGRCREEWYCSNECKHSAWGRYHQVICKGLPGLRYTLTTNGYTSPAAHACLLLLKFLATTFRNPDATARLKTYTPMPVSEIRATNNAPTIPPDLETFFHLLPRPLKQEDNHTIRILLSKFRFIAQQGLGEEHLGFLLERFQGNNHVVADERLVPIGHAILPEISRHCNHSCVPSGVVASVWSPQEKKIQVMIKLMRPVNPGEPVTIPYLDPILPLQDRQTFLAERYGFTCTCPLCDFQASLPPTVLTQEATPRKLGDMYDEYVARYVDPLRQETPYAPWTAFKPGGPLPGRAKPFLPSRVQMKSVSHDKIPCLKADVVRELTGMFSEGIEAEEWELARETGQHVLGVYVVVYGWRHPLVGLHLLELSKVRFRQSILDRLQTPEARERFVRSIQDASIYALWARECLETSTTLRGMGNGGGGVKDELYSVEDACADGWEILEEGRC